MDASANVTRCLPARVGKWTSPLRPHRPSGSGIQIRNSGENFFLKFFFFNSDQFLLNTFLSKMIIYPKKMCFLPKKVCFLYFSCSPHSSTRPNCLYNLCRKSGQKIGKEFDFAQVRTLFFSGKKPDPENPGKIRIWNFLYLWSDIEFGQYNKLFY